MIGEERDFRASDAAAAESVVDFVRGHIERGQLRPGDRLPPERVLAQKIGVSRPSVRAGLRSLHGPAARYSEISGVRQHDGWLYLGSLAESSVGRVSLPPQTTGSHEAVG